MKQIILDTNFIMTCIKQKIDFFQELKLMGIQILIPKQVIAELKKNKAELELLLLQKEKNFFKEIDIGKGHVDKNIINYIEDKPEILVATLDKEVQSLISNQKMIIRGKKKLEII